MFENKIIYLDNCSTTPIDPDVAKAINETMSSVFGNPSSIQNNYGIQANILTESSREKIANFFNVKPKNIIFTSGATESNNLILKGLYWQYRDKRNKIIISAIEHSSVYETAITLKTDGAELVVIKTNDKGEIDLQQLCDSLDEKTLIVSIIGANNEIGTVQDIEAISRICKEKGVLFHTDLAQAVGKIRIDLSKLGVDFATLSAHKNYGPKGIGALYISDSAKQYKLKPLIEGGGQENNIRSGTLNVPLIVGFAKSLEISKLKMEEEIVKIKTLRLKLEKLIFSKCPDAVLNSVQENRLPGVLNFHFSTIPVNSIINELRTKVAFSTGSACGESSNKGSRVLYSLGLSEFAAKNSIRLCVGRFNTEDDIERASDFFEEAYKKLKIF